MARLVFMHYDMDGVAAIAAVFDIVLIITTNIQSDMSRMAAKRTEDSFIKELHQILPV